jgi:hypothetical protein
MKKVEMIWVGRKFAIDVDATYDVSSMEESCGGFRVTARALGTGAPPFMMSARTKTEAREVEQALHEAIVVVQVEARSV